MGTQRLKLRDCAPASLIEEHLPHHGAEFIYGLPFKEYTHPHSRFLNLAAKFPEECGKPAYGVGQELGCEDFVTKLHCNISDVVNVLTHTAEVTPNSQQLRTVERLKKAQIEQDRRETLGNCHSADDNVDGGNLSNYSRSESNVDGGALWDIFLRQDVPKLQEYLRKHFNEFRHTYCCPSQQIIHPIHDQNFYLTREHKRKLKEECGIEPWTCIQKLGDAIFVPAGCPYQVRNLKSCIKVAVQFVSPESVGDCFRLTEECRTLPKDHGAKEDKLEVKKMIVHAMREAVDILDQSVRTGRRGRCPGMHTQYVLSGLARRQAVYLIKWTQTLSSRMKRYAAGYVSVRQHSGKTMLFVIMLLCDRVIFLVCHYYVKANRVVIRALFAKWCMLEYTNLLETPDTIS